MFIVTDEVCPVGLDQGFFYQIVVFRVPVLDQRPLHGFFMGVRRHIDLFHGPGIQPRIVHASRDRGGRRVEILHLLRHVPQVSQVFRQLHGLLHRTARM